jgi:hypothetical protein
LSVGKIQILFPKTPSRCCTSWQTPIFSFLAAAAQKKRQATTMNAVLWTMLWTVVAQPGTAQPPVTAVACPQAACWHCCRRHRCDLCYLTEYYQHTSYDFGREFDYPWRTTTTVPQVYVGVPNVVRENVAAPTLSAGEPHAARNEQAPPARLSSPPHAPP